MIRRETESEWILIAQIEHARLAAVVAKQWEAVDSELLNEPLMFAIEHHDDGWKDWDSNADFINKIKKPLSFTEMSIFDTSKIWSDGIQSCANHSKESGLLASQHFVWLAEHIANNENRPEEERQCASKFIERQRELQTAWQQTLTKKAIEKLPARLEVLQLLDRFSLWVCCDESEQPATPMKSQHHPTFSLNQSSPQMIEVENFPGFNGELLLETSCKRIPVEISIQTDQLSKALREPHSDSIKWQLSSI